jgi:hypothetical protein
MNNELLEEIKRFRQMSNLPIIDKVKSKLPLNEGRGDSIWKFVLELGEMDAEAIERREARLRSMFSNGDLKMPTSQYVKGGEKKAVTDFINTIETKVRSGASIDDILGYMTEKLGPTAVDEITEKIGKYIDENIQLNITKELGDYNSQMYIDVVKDFNDEVSELMKKSDAAKDGPLVKKKILDEIKKRFISKYKQLLGLSDEEGKIIDDIFETEYRKRVSELTPNINKDLTWAQSFMTLLRGAPLLLDEISEIFNLTYLTITKSVSYTHLRAHETG